MATLNEKILQSAESKATPSNASQPAFGYGHKDIDEDFAALKSVLGISAFSSEFKQLKNSFATLKTFFKD
ncbi:MAG: hypothetical protein ACU837_10575 [Gammaproteobacteria bacterium]